jgi:two-component system OmpR family sensor kinase
MTIRLRLTLYWAAVLATILLVAAIASIKLFERQQWSALDAALLEEGETAAKEIERTNLAGARTVLESLSREVDLGPGRRVRIVTANGVIDDFGNVNTIPPGSSPDLPPRAMIVSNSPFRFAVVPLLLAGEPAYLQSGLNAHLIQESVANLRNSLLLMVPVVLVLCVAGGYWLAGRALRPIESVTAELNEIQPTNLRSRLPVPPVADEVARLTAVINALLERLERASVTERRFASDAAHELRTPLAVLRTGLEVTLARDRSSDENHAALVAAHREVLSLCRIADELLMLARLNGEVSVERSRLNLRELVVEIASTVEPLAQAREIQLRVAADQDVFVEGNAGHLRRLVINLLDNALKFTPVNGSIEARLTMESNRVILRVADSGPGIDAAEMPFIFDRFFRGATAPGEGSGLGLSLCREIARLHGGDITAANRPSGGSVFVVTLPAASRTAAKRVTAQVV